MKKLYLLLFAAVMLITGCQKNEGTNTNANTSILQGTWSSNSEWVDAFYTHYGNNYCPSHNCRNWVVEFVDDNTLYNYHCVCDNQTSLMVNTDCDNAIPMPGHSGWYYDYRTLYTYVFQENKVFLTNGTIYTYLNGKLYEDGYSDVVLSPWNGSGTNSGIGTNSGNGNDGGDNNGAANLVGSYNGHEYIDLGLPSGTLWATCNIGAYSPESYGNYFAWGETYTKTSYGSNNYIHQYIDHNDNYHIKKYNTKSDYGTVDNLTTLQAADDAATAKWGNGWRIPSKTEWDELYNHTSVTKTTQNGVKGLLFTADNGGCLFLPIAGFYFSYGFTSGCCRYWTNQLDTDTPYLAWCMSYSISKYSLFHTFREIGAAVRPVH